VCEEGNGKPPHSSHSQSIGSVLLGQADWLELAWTVKNIGGKPKFGGQNVVKTDKCMGVS